MAWRMTVELASSLSALLPICTIDSHYLFSLSKAKAPNLDDSLSVQSTDTLGRYRQTCKLCGTIYDKGRMESMKTHITKPGKCPRITESQRIDACLALHDISRDRSPRDPQQSNQQQQVQHIQAQHAQHQQAHMPALDLTMLQSHEGWTPLETLAAVSRAQLDRGGNGEEATQQKFQGQFADGFQQYHVGLTPFSGAMDTNHHGGVTGQAHGYDDGTTPLGDTPNLTVAAAATARLNSEGMFDPNLFTGMGGNMEANLGEELARVIGSVETAEKDQPTVAPDHSPPASQVTASNEFSEIRQPTPNSHSIDHIAPSPGLRMPTFREDPQPTTPAPPTFSPAPTAHTALSLATDTEPSSRAGQPTPWGQYSFISTGASPPAPVTMQPMMGTPSRSVFRVSQNGNQNQHTRARFSEPKRKEVQRIRQLGSCIRCKVLRKGCSEGDPCETCNKVLSPRIWKQGCIRTKFFEKLDIYNARVQAIQCSREVEARKSTWDLKHPIAVLDATQAGTGVAFSAEVILGTRLGEGFDPTLRADLQDNPRMVVMIADDEHQLPCEKMEIYAKEVLSELVNVEESAFSRVTLETAQHVLIEESLIAEQEDSEHKRRANRNLNLALELWAYVEIIEREEKWTYNVRASEEARTKAHSITRESDAELFKTLGLQLCTAAEIQAETIAKQLFRHITSQLSDGKAHVGRSMFFAIMLLLICIEKTTWAFMSWEKIPDLRAKWPLERQPSSYTAQGEGIARDLRTLLEIRHELPATGVREEDGVLVDVNPESQYQSYFQRINLNGQWSCPWLLAPYCSYAKLPTAHHVSEQRFNHSYHPTTSRSLELRFCSVVLLPEQLQSPPLVQAHDHETLAPAAPPGDAAAGYPEEEMFF